MSTMNVPDSPHFNALVAWLKDVTHHRQFGFLRTPDGEDFVVMRPEQLAELDAILADPAFAAAVEDGAADIMHGRSTRVGRGMSLQDASDDTVPVDDSLAAAVDEGVDDVVEGRVRQLQRGRTLEDLL